MVITTTILKEKNVTINQFIPAQKMQIKMNRINIMPENPENNTIQCELKLAVSIMDDMQKDLAVVNLSYIVIAILENDEVYNKDESADRIFSVLQAMYVSETNNLLRESPFPPIPMNVKC